MTWKKKTIQIIEKHRLVDINLREGLKLGNANNCEMHYQKDDLEFIRKLQNKFSCFFMLIASVKIPKLEERISSCGFHYGLLSDS